jgi:hypothetical protein
MKEFNKFVEAILITAQPQSDSAGAVEPSCPCQQRDMFSQATDKFMDTLNPSDDQEIQPEDGVGETGEIQGDEQSDVELECMGEQGLKVKFNGMEILLPKNVVEQIKEFESGEGEGEGEGSSEPEAGETQEHEEGETAAEEKSEHEEDGEKEEKDEKKDSDDMFESAIQELQEKKKNWIKDAVNKEHEGYCTPESKPTCTPRRKALAKRFKKMAKNK